MTSPSYEHLDVRRDGGVVTVTLNRPDVLNAVNGTMHTELVELLTWLAGLDDLGAVLLTGAGRGFCAGGDARWFETATPEQVQGVFDEGSGIIQGILDIPAPVVAAVNGPAMGLGATIALFCDVVYASDTAVIADPHVRMGVVAGDGGAAVWPALVGLSRAKEYLMTGDPITAVEAERIGLVNRVVPAAELLPVAGELVRRLADGPRLAIRGTKKILNDHLRGMTDLVLAPGLALEHETMLSADHREAVAAFVGRRQPVFTGK
jgi:enoyl-CoA hydratase